MRCERVVGQPGIAHRPHRRMSVQRHGERRRVVALSFEPKAQSGQAPVPRLRNSSQASNAPRTAPESSRSRATAVRRAFGEHHVCVHRCGAHLLAVHHDDRYTLRGKVFRGIAMDLVMAVGGHDELAADSSRRHIGLELRP